MKRFDIHDDVLFDLHPGYNGEVMVPAANGSYVKYKEVLALLDKITHADPDLSPREAVVMAIFADVNEMSDAEVTAELLDRR